jgi:hypothetical protein
MMVHFCRRFISSDEQLDEILDGEHIKGCIAYPQSRFTQIRREDRVKGNIEEDQTPFEETISSVG